MSCNVIIAIAISAIVIIDVGLSGTQLTVKATKSANVSREVTFDIKVQDAHYPDCLYAEGRTLTLHPTLTLA